MSPAIGGAELERLLQQARADFQRQNWRGAQASLERLLRHAPNHVEGLFLLGSLHAQQGRPHDAVELLKRAARLGPQNPSTHNNLAIVLEQLGRSEEALAAYRHSLSLQPAQAETHNNLGDLLRKEGRLDEASKHLEQALTLRGDYVQAMNNLALAYQVAGRTDEAENLLRRALALAPEYVSALSNLGALFHGQARYAEAEPLLRQAATLSPRHVPALSNLGAVLTRLHRLDEADEVLARAAGLSPDSSDILVNRALLRHEQGCLDSALALYDQALGQTPAAAAIRWHRGFSHLLKGDLAAGWADYEAGLETGDRQVRAVNAPRWRGEPIPGRHLWLLAEQGLGDEIMFATCLPDVIARAGRCRVECDARLVALFRRSFPAIDFVPRNGVATEPEPDYVIPMGSLPGLFRPSLPAFPATPALLQADASAVDRWRHRLAQLGPGLKIGVSWRGGVAVDPAKRSIALDRWRAILQTPGCHFISLQYGDHDGDRAQARAATGVTVHHWPESNPLAEQDDFAAQIRALDLVISVSNATAHLAGALGVPTWNLIPHVPSWRWFLGGDHTPWYSSMRLFRQPAAGDWAAVIAAAAGELATFSPDGIQ